MALAALAAIPRLAGDLAGNPGWYTDEGAHLEIARHLLSGEARFLAVQSSTLLFARPPLFHLLLAGLATPFGLSMGVLRALTATLGCLSVVALYLTLHAGARRWAGGPRALPALAAGALALAPTPVLYSRFGFSYSLLAALTPVFLLGVWGHLATRSRSWLALAALAAGLGLVSDLWAGALLAPLVLAALWRRPRDLAWSLPLALAPFALYAAMMALSAPPAPGIPGGRGAAFEFDLRYTFLRLNAIPLGQQLAVLADNAQQIARQEPWFALAGLGLLAVRPARLRLIALLTFGLPLLLLGRTVALYSLSAYYLIPLFPLAALGLGALGERVWDWAAQRGPARAALGVAVLLAGLAALAVSLAQAREGFTTPIDPFLVDAADARAAADFVNARVAEEDVVIASPAVAWQLAGRAADFQMAAAAAGVATPHLPADLPAERWAFDPRFERARFVIVDDLWRNWAAVHIPAVDAQLRAMDNWPIVFRAGQMVIYQNPNPSITDQHSPNPMPKPSFLFGTVGTPLSTPKKPGGTVGGIARTAELGLGAMELAWVQSVRVSEAKCAEIKAAAAAHGVALSVHAPYFINLNATAEEWPKSRKRLMDAAHYGHLAGATDIIFHPGSYFGRPPAEVLATAIPRLRGCVQELRDAGNPVVLRPETMGKSAMLGSLEDTLALAAEIDGVLPCLDFAHLHARPGDGTANSYAEWTAMLKLVKKRLGAAGLKSLHLHLSGIAYGPKGEKHHLTLAEADLKYKELFKVLRDLKCAGRVLGESPIMEDDALTMQTTWLKLTKSY